MLDQKQAEDQAGFRKSYQTTDHLATYRLIEQKCQEWGIKMWTATVDFTKAFDSISHKSIWDALKSCNIDHEYVSLLRKIYKDQKASVQTDEESEIFDDVMLFATSKEQLRNMMYQFKKATEKVGLKIHPDKTKILSNQSNMNSNTKRYIKVGEMNIEILTKNESVKYLGRRISFHQQETIEIKNRIRAAWATFHKNRQELTSKNSCSNTVYDFSTPQFLRLSVTPRERGLRTKNTKE